MENDVVKKRAVLLMRLCLLSFTIAMLIHKHHDASAIEYRDGVVAALKEYEKIHGQLPSSLYDIPALESDGLRPHFLRHYRDKDSALLVYSPSMSPHLKLKYDFSKQEWKSDSD